MRYFQVQFRDFVTAAEAIWAADDAADQPPSVFRVSAAGQHSTVFTYDTDAAEKLRQQLTTQGAEFKEEDFQVVVDWFNSKITEAAAREREALREQGIVIEPS